MRYLQARIIRQHDTSSPFECDRIAYRRCLCAPA